MPEPTAPLPAGRASRPTSGERRAFVRYPCERESSCRTFSARQEEVWKAQVKDLSEHGIGLLLGRRFEPGILLAIDLPTDGSPRLLLARVVHATARDGGWLIGCQLVNPLADDDLQELI